MSNTFTLEISTTQKCNLGCPYCYVANRDTPMSIETFNESLPKIIELMERSDTKELNVSFFGGEPMLNWDLIVHATNILKKLPITKNIVIISNMTMIDEEKLDWIKKSGVGVSWSFDGMGSNTSRPLLPMLENQDADGNMYNGILDLYKDKMHLISQLTNGCKVMIWPGNMHEMTDNYEYFLKWGISHPDFSLVRDDVWTKEDLVVFRDELKKLADKYIEVTKAGVISSIGFFKLAILDNILGLTLQKRKWGCFAGVHGAVLMYDGTFYPCARFASKKLMQIDEEYNFKYWQEQFKPENYDKCKKCELYKVCNAGCTYSQVLNDNKPLDSVCELFHIIQEQTQRIVHELRDDKTFHKIIDMSLRSMG